MSRLIGFFVVTIIASLALGPGIAVATEDPRFETTVNERYVTPGQSQPLTVTLVNDAEDSDDSVEPATNVKAELGAGATPFTVTSGTVYPGTVEDGVPTQLQFAIEVPQDVTAGSYSIPIEVTYEFEGDERETTTSYVHVSVRDRARFAIVNSSSTLQVRSEGSMTATVRNIGSEPATGATLEMESRSGVMAFEDDRSGVRSLGNVSPGENRQVNFTMRATDDANPKTYPVVGSIRYDDEEGVRRSSGPLATSITVTREQTFELFEIRTKLRVDREGSLTVEVLNSGPREVENANLRIETDGTGLYPTQSAIALGNLDPGESTDATYEISVDGETTATPRQVTLQLEYDDVNGDHRFADSKRLRVPVKPDEPAFDVEPFDNDITAGASGIVRLEVTNNDPVKLSSVNMKAFTDAPVSITDDSAFVSELEPGESTVVALQVSAPDASLTKEYPISVDFQYDEPDGDTKLTETYDLPVSVEEGTTIREQLSERIAAVDISKNFLLGGGFGFGLVVIGVGAVRMRNHRRNDE
jgi:hypothetical protein